MRNSEQKNNTCKVGQKGSRVPLRFKNENIRFVSSQRESLRVSTTRLLNHELRVKQREGYRTRKVIWSKQVEKRYYVFAFTGVNRPHEGVWRFDLDDIWNGSHVQLGSHSWKEILQIKRHTHPYWRQTDVSEALGSVRAIRTRPSLSADVVKFDLFGNSVIWAGIDQKPVSPHVWKLWPSCIADGINMVESEKEL